ncbi:MAG: beta-glucosidase, partial [Acidobacteria bacterium]|nr:beta-glucosidase [Acidobacteriota bacterium]
LGQAGGGAVADVLFGVVNPSGRLAETIPVKLADTPAFLDFPGENSHVRYSEGLFVGYRYYDARTVDVSYPFGHGLSYTTFAYDGLQVSASQAGVHVSVEVTNAGTRAGREVVQAYVGLPGSTVVRAQRELRAFASIALEAGQSERVELAIPCEDLAYYNVPAAAWTVEGGDYLVEVGASSRDLRVSASVTVEGNQAAMVLSTNSTIGEWMAHPVGGPVLGSAFEAAIANSDDDESMANALADPSMMAMLSSMPLGRLAAFPGSPLTPELLDQLVAAGNA